MYKQKILGSASLTWGLLLSLSIGCGGPQKKAEEPAAGQAQAQPQPPPPAVPAKPPQVMLRLDAIGNGQGAHELQVGESLRSGDKMAVNVAVDQPTYVYVAFASVAGAPQVVFPKSGDQQVTPDQPLRIPANPEKWITLDKQTGQEDVFVYASSKPIPSSDLTNMVNADAASAKKAAAKKSAHSGSPKVKVVKPKGNDDALSAGSRGVQIDDDDTDTTSTSSTNPNIVVKKFSVTHK
jgi:hypothetical protein